MTVVFTPQRHVCDGLSQPAAYTAGLWCLQDFADLHTYALGTVRSCSCGKTWVAGEQPGLIPSIWRREGWFERRWREWRQR